jgi:iron(III) transport system permease protein
VQAYNLAADERLAEASTASLAIVAVGLLPVIVASRRLVRRGTPRRPASRVAARLGRPRRRYGAGRATACRPCCGARISAV